MIEIPGDKLYALLDTDIKCFITWIEKNESAIFLFSTGEMAERYASVVFPKRPIKAYPIHNSKSRDFMIHMINRGIHYALIDVPPEHADPFEEKDDEVVRNYAIVNLKSAYQIGGKWLT